MRFRFAAGFVAALGLMAGAPIAATTVHAAARPAPDTLEVAIVAPHDGLALNAAALDIQALVSAQRAGRSDDDVWTGWMRIDLAIDGVAAQTFDPTVCRGQVAAGFRVNLAGLAPGAHVATVTASKKTRGIQVRGSASMTFVLDPTLPIKEPNRIEAAATPTPFACLSTPDFDPDDDDRADDFDFRFATLRGSFVANALSSGIDLSRDRVVLAVDDQLVVIEPGSFACRAHNRCRFTNRTASSLVRSVRLEQKRRGRWTFTVATRRRPGPLHSLFLRIGANWGGLDYVNDRYVAALAPSLDTGHRAQATIGPTGGHVQTRDATGVVVGLDVPAGALTQNTIITITPLLASPLPNAAKAFHPGVQFEPEGLVFATPATLTLDFGPTGRPIADDDVIVLLTSPLTTLPLPTTADPAHATLTARLRHFSEDQGGQADPAYVDLREWADAVLSSSGNLTVSELESLLELTSLQQRLGCSEDCVDVGELADRAGVSIGALVGEICPAGTAPVASDVSLGRLLRLEAIAQGLGVNATSIRPCAEWVLTALIDAADTTLASADPSDPTMTRLKQLAARAQALGFASLQARALAKVDVALRDLAARILGQARSAAGTPGEGAARDAARTALEQEKALVLATNADVIAQDPGLVSFIQAQIDSLTSSPMTVLIRQNYLGDTQLGAGTNGYCGPLTGPTNDAVRCEISIVGIGADVLLSPATTFSLSAHSSLSSMTVTASQPSPNVLTWDATASASSMISGPGLTGSEGGPVTGGVSTQIGLALTFTQTGRLEFDFNHAWSALATTPYPGVARAAIDGADLQYNANWINGVFNNDGPLEITGPSTLLIRFFLVLRSPGNAPPDTWSGAGRVLTMTFTPQ